MEARRIQVPWVANRPDGYHFAAEPLEINAAPDVVWNLMKSIDRYSEFSNGSIRAHVVQGELKTGNTIHFVLYPNKAIGKFMPESDETINMVDDENHIVGWERRLPGYGESECYRVLEPLEDGKKTRSHIELKIPGFVGFFTNALYKNAIQDAFNELNQGIKRAAEEQQNKITP
jgi:Polyketide cyclase / dehydrase and lipid transport